MSRKPAFMTPTTANLIRRRPARGRSFRTDWAVAGVLACVLGVVLPGGLRAEESQAEKATSIPTAPLTASGSLPSAAEELQRAVTSSSKLFKGAFSQQYGLVEKINVKRGDSVKVGAILVELDSAVEKAQYDFYMLQADTSLQMSAAQQEHQLAEVRFARAKDIFAKGGGNKFEVEETEADAAVKRITIDIRKREGEIALAQARSQQARIDQMRIKSPVEGIVSEIHFKEGEIVDQNKAVIEVAQLDPLYIEMKDIPHQTVATLKVGQSIEVRYRSTNLSDKAPQSPWKQATINFISPLVDEATGFRLIRLQMPNPTLDPAGIEVDVRLPAVAAPLAQAAQ